LRETGANLRRNPTLTLASVLTIAVSLSLVGASLLLGDGVRNATQRWQGGVEVVVFLNQKVTPAQRAALGSFIDENPLVKRKSYVDQNAAYREYRKINRDNPSSLEAIRSPKDLPPSFRIVPKDATIQSVQDLRQVFEGRPGVYKVSAAADAVKKIQRLSGLLTTGLALTAVFLLLASMLLIVNTIRMAAFARRREIEVMKLVGATNWFIRVPFMLEGLAQGLVGAAVSAGAVFSLNRLFKDRLAHRGPDRIELLQSFVVEQSHVLTTCSVLVLVGVLVGVIGSGIAVGRFVDV